MQTYPNPVRIKRFLFLLVVLVSLALPGCSAPTAVNTPAPPTQAPATQLAAPSPTAVPSPTPASSLVILLAPEGADPQSSAAFQRLVMELAGQSGLRFEMRPVLSQSDLTDEVKIVLALPPVSNLRELASSAPQTQFVAIGIPEIQPAGNLISIGGKESSPDQAAFLAGYLAAIVTPDWRAGVLSESGSTSGTVTRSGFTNGLVYFCGLCRPASPPFPAQGYPLAAELSAASQEADWQAAAADFHTWGVQTVYVDPSIASDALLNFLAGSGFNLIGSGAPPAGLQEHWIASIDRQDSLQALRKAWPGLVNGEGISSLGLSLELSQVNDNLLSPGRRRLVEDMLDKLSNGWIDTGVNPAMSSALQK